MNAPAPKFIGTQPRSQTRLKAHRCPLLPSDSLLETSVLRSLDGKWSDAVLPQRLKKKKVERRLIEIKLKNKTKLCSKMRTLTVERKEHEAKSRSSWGI